MQVLPGLPHYLFRNAEHYVDRVAMRYKDPGIWHEWTWANACTSVQALSLSLKGLRLQPIVNALPNGGIVVDDQRDGEQH